MQTDDQKDDCCSVQPQDTARSADNCPVCNEKGRKVSEITIESLVSEPARERLSVVEGFRFCATPGCEIAYFHPQTGERILAGEVLVRIGKKQTAAPRPACYCFDHSVEQIEAQVAATGTSSIPDEVTEKCRQGLDRCEETNPQGSCCLGDLRRIMKEAQAARSEPVTAPLPLPDEAGVGVSEDCCATPAAVAPPSGGATRNVGLWATSGAVFSAVLSSACCWLPLLLIGFGASAAGVAGFFETYRPILLAATGVLLAAGFYLVYFRKEACEPGSTCAAPNPRLRRFNQVSLWLATVFVAGFAFFPSYVGALMGPGGGEVSLSAGESQSFAIEGMTCEGCASGLATALRDVPGVRAAEVSYELGRATVALGEDGDPQAVLDAISAHGYEGRLVSPERGAQ